MRVQLAVWTDDTIAVEVVVARVVIVVITTIGIFYLANLLVAHLLRVDAHRLHDVAVQALVNEVPVETALVDRVLANQVPVFLEVTTRVAHGVVVLTLDEWHLAVRVLAVVLTVLHRVVHRAEDVGALALTCLLILYRTACVLTLHPLVGVEEVVAHHRLVAQAPGHDARMIVEVGYVVLVALQYLLGKHRFLGSGIVVVAESVALLVGFCHDVETILITEVVPARVVWIVTSTYGVDVQSLHHLDVLYHALHAHYISSVRIHLVTVGALDEHRLSIDEELLVLDFYLAETYLHRDSADASHALALCCREADDGVECVEVRCLSCPLLRVGYLEDAVSLAICRLDDFLDDNLASHVVVQLIYHYWVALHGSLDVEHTVLVVVHEVGCHTDVFYLCLGITGIEVVLTSHAAESPEVLVLTPRTIAPAEGLEGDEVLTFLHIRGDVELSSYLAVLGIAHELAVHIEIDVGGDATEVCDHLFAVPILRDVDDAAVGAYVVVLGRYGWRLLVEVTTPCEAGVDILWLSEAEHLPVAWHLDVAPLGVIEVSLVEVGRTLVGVLHPVEFPGAVE